jgi:lysophospholipase L1-like esterase
MFTVPALDPLPRAPLPTAALSQLHQAKIICDGNSITQSVYGPETSYPQQLENQLSQLGYGVKVMNVAVWGRTSAHMLNNALWQVDRLYEPTRLNLLIAMEGGNHIYFGATPQVAYATFAKYCMARRDAGYRVIAIDTFPRANGYFPGDDRVAAYAADLLEYNRLIRTHWRDFADDYFDARLNLPELNTQPPYMNDGVHPSIAGNKRLATTLATFLVNQFGA